MALTKIDDRGLKTPVDLLDNEKIRFGTGNDLEIYHSSSDNHSYIKEGGTGDLKIQGAHIHFESHAGDETFAKFIDDGAVELYHNNSKKLATSGSGVEIENGDLRVHLDLRVLNDNRKLTLGTGTDLQLYHDGTNSLIKNITGSLSIQGDDIRLLNNGASEALLKAFADGGVELFYDSARKFHTNSDGVIVTGDINVGSGNYFCNDNGKIRLGGSQDLELYHGGTDSHITNATGQLKIASDTVRITNGAVSETQALFTANGAAELYHDDVKKISTAPGGAIIHGSEGANSTILFYADEGDDADDLWLAQATTSNEFKIQNYASGAWEKSIECNGNGNVELYHDNNLKFKTTSDGVVVTGGIYLDGSGGGNAANKMDDYEEGTFDGKFVTNSGTFPTQTVVGKYTKVGNQVTIHCQITFSGSAGSGGGMAWIELPFSCTSARGGMAIGLVSGVEWSADHQLFLVPEISSQACYLLEVQPNSAGHTHMSPAAFKNSASKLFSYGGSYITT